jgi:hypothetical protein
VQTHLNSYDGTGSRPIKMSSNWDDENGEGQTYISPQMRSAFGIERDD